MLAQATAKPKLVGILSTSSEPSKFYAEFTRRQCEDLGVEFVLKKTGAALQPGLAEGEGVEDAIIEANEDDSVNGIMVCGFYYPFYKEWFLGFVVDPLCYDVKVYFPIYGPQQDHYLQQVRLQIQTQSRMVLNRRCIGRFTLEGCRGFALQVPL
jgi:methylenetetrahydrofolate dehydrogenase (NAD+)